MEMQDLRQLLRGQRKGLADYLNWGNVIGSGVVLNKDGSLMGGWFYRGPDVASSMNSERNYLVERANDALARLGGGWSIWVEADRLETSTYPSPDRSHFPDPVSRAVDDERRAMFEAEGQHFESEYAIVLQYTPPLRRQSRIVDLVYSDSGAKPEPGDVVLATFEKTLSDIEASMGHAVHMKRMRGYTRTDALGRVRYFDQMANFLSFCLSGDPTEVELPACGGYLDSVIGAGDFYPGNNPMIGDKYIAVVSIRGWPTMSYANILDIFDDIPVPLRWSSRFIYVDPAEGEKRIKAHERKWKQKARGLLQQVFKQQGGAPPNEDAIDMSTDAIEALRRTNSGLAATGYYTPTIVLMHEDPALVMKWAMAIRREVRGRNFNAEIETMNTVEAWIGSLPGHTIHNVRRPLMHTDNLADLLPFSSIWTGLEVHPCEYYPPNSPPLLHAATGGSTPYRLVHHVDDVGHTLLFGPTGSGKTTLLCLIMMQALRYAGMRIWAFDYKRGMLATTKACRGNYYDIGQRRGGPSFCPLSLLRTEADIPWAMDWIATCFQLQTRAAPLSHHRDAIRVALINMVDPDSEKTLTHFCALVQNAEVRSAIEYYTLAGVLGHILDADEDNVDYSSLMAFEMEDLMGMSETAVLPVLLYLFKRFELGLDGSPTLLMIDEAWVVLGHPTFRAKLKEWFRVLRSKNCSVILSTQLLSDAARSDMSDVLVESCATMIALANDAAQNSGIEGNPGPRQFYGALGFTDKEISIIASAVKRRDYYVKSSLGRRLINLGLGPITLAFAGASSKPAIKRVLELERIYGQGWPDVWLREVASGKMQATVREPEEVAA